MNKIPIYFTTNECPVCGTKDSIEIFSIRNNKNIILEKTVAHYAKCHCCETEYMLKWDMETNEYICISRDNIDKFVSLYKEEEK